MINISDSLAGQCNTGHSVGIKNIMITGGPWFHLDNSRIFPDRILKERLKILRGCITGGGGRSSKGAYAIDIDGRSHLIESVAVSVCMASILHISQAGAFFSG